MLENYKIYIYDFEVFSKQTPSWWCVSFLNYANDEIITIINDREKLIEFYKKNKDAIYVGYNSRIYDQFEFKGILDGLDAGKINDNLMSGKKGYQVVKNANKYILYNYDIIMKDKSLKQIECFLGDDIRETTVPFDKKEPLTKDEINQIKFYNQHDVKETKKTLKYVLDDLEGQLDIIELYNLDMEHISKTKVQLASFVLNAVNQHSLSDEFDIILPNTIHISDKNKHICNWFLNPKNWRYKEVLHSDSDQHPNQYLCNVANIPHVFAYGGAHGCDDKESIFVGNILHLDVASMYPTIDIEYNLLSRKVKDPNLFRQMRDFRLKLKKEHNSKQKSLKPMINGIYGASKDKNNPMRDFRQANLTCIFGQMFILALIDEIENDCKLLQTNTDGIFILYENEQQKEKILKSVDKISKETKMVFEIEEYDKLIQKDVNNYIAVPKNCKNENELECKGAFVKFNKPIDNDCSILNDAVRRYLVYNISVEDTINQCNELIKFQKVVKLSSKYKEVWKGKPISQKDKKGVIKVTHIDGKKLNEKVHRIFASTNINDGGIYKLKVQKGEYSYEKIANTPDNCFIINSDIHNKTIPDYLDKQYYIDEAKKRIEKFLTKEPEKIDNTANILYDCMCKSNNFYEFLENANNNNITGKVLEKYIIANCCAKYGKTYKLLKFIQYYKLIYNKTNFNISSLSKKFNDNEQIIDIIKSFSNLSSTGKKLIDVNYKAILLKIFDMIENKEINILTILRQQCELFGEPCYIDDTYDENIYYITNYRNVIKPTVILYNIKTGKTEYRKIKKESWNILPLQDADLIKITNTELSYEQKIVGKDENGINQLEADINRPYQLIVNYEIIARDYEGKINVQLD